MQASRSRLTPLILLFEDLQWLDSASEDLLAKIIDIEELRLLDPCTHAGRNIAIRLGPRSRAVARLSIEPLSARETSRIGSGARLGVDHLPEALAKLIAAKAEGNALFAEEIASFLVERGIVRYNATRLGLRSGRGRRRVAGKRAVAARLAR